MKTEKEHIETYLDDELIAQFDDKRADSGKAALTVQGIEAHFDNVIITGTEIPDNGTGDFAVHCTGKLAITWATLRTTP